MTDVASAELDAAQNAIITAGTTYELGLNTADPGETGANLDTTVTKQPITFGASSGGTQASTSAQSFSISGTNTYTNFSVWTNAATPVYVRGGALSASLTPGAGGTISFAAGAVTFTAA